MATSGSWNYSVTAAQIIQAALEDLGVVDAGGSVASADSTIALQRLNFIAKQWQAMSDMAPGLKVWTRQRVTLFLAKGQQTYLIGPASTDAHATTQYGRTTVSAAEASGQTTISITSNTDTTTYPGTTVTMTNGDIVGVVLDDGTIQWTTISGTPSTTMTIADALTGDAGAGNYVYWFTSRAQRLPLVDSAWLRDADLTDSMLAVYADAAEYDIGVSDKYADGDPTAILVEPLRLNTRLSIDSQPDDVTKQIWLTAYYPSEDYDATSDDIAFPQEWFAALEWELAFRLAPAFGKPWDQTMEANRSQALAMARQVNPENTAAYFEPGRD